MRSHLPLATAVAFWAWTGIGLGEEPVLKGRVVDERGRPLAGAEVFRVWQDEWRYRRCGPEETELSTTDGDGFFSLPLPHAGALHLEIFAPRFVPLATPKTWLSSATAGIDLGTLSLEPGAVVVGTVTDTAGRPLAAVEVRAHHRGPRPRAQKLARRSPGEGEPPDAVSDAEGRFELNTLRPYEVLSLEATLQGYSPVFQNQVIASAAEPQSLVLHPLTSIRGRVMDETGVPLPREAVRVTRSGWSESEPGPFELDESGRFVVPEVELGSLRLDIEAEGFAPQRVGLEVEADKAPNELVVTLRRTGEVEGRVTFSSGEPVGDAWVGFDDPRPRLGGCGDESGEESGATTDAQGYFLLKGVPPGERTIYAGGALFGEISRAVQVSSGSRSRLDLILPPASPAYSLTGRVFDELGRPVKNAMIQMLPESASGGHALSLEDGSFESDPLAEGQYRLRISQVPGFATYVSPQPITISGGPVTGIEIRLSRGATLSGRILGLSIEELLEVQLSAERSGESHTPRWIYVDGSFTLPHLGPGLWTLWAQLPFQDRTVGSLVVVEPGATEVNAEIRVLAGVAATGRVALAGVPLAGATVKLEGLESLVRLHADTDGRGVFKLKAVTPGRYRATTRTSEHGGLVLPDVEIRAGEELLLDYRRSP